ncbi:ATP-binding cassette domain-containing protein [Nocardia sp. NPDC049190]|uniref:ABC transporter ATP-binding protein n=1 Tax=Nocardia sp. NPDC049190 TaxID=3155650 RepID=UPI0034021ACB
MGDLVLVDGLTVLGADGQELFGPTTFRMSTGSVTALTGPSGSGKTTLMRALLGQLPSGSAGARGSVQVSGHEVPTLDRVALQQFRRQHIAFAGQDPGSALNPLLRVHALLREVAPNAPNATLAETLELVGLSPQYLRRRPGELSGGQQRRVALARAIIRRTGVLVLDEPLAGLHGALRGDIAGQLTALARRRSAAILLSGHDTALVHSIADNVVELGTVAARMTSPALATVRFARRDADGRPPRRWGEKTTQKTTSDARVGSADSSPRTTLPGREARVTVVFDQEHTDEPVTSSRRCTPEAVTQNGSTRDEFVLRAKGIGASVDGRQVLADIDLDLRAGAAVAVVGASGAGKTTLARVIAGLHASATGLLELRDRSFSIDQRRRISYSAGGIQLVTQNPRSALNPRRTVAHTLGRPLRRIVQVPKRALPERVTELLAAVELPADLASRYPHELSGGQRQRVALARAVAAEPAVLLCDEITSALDHATAASIMSLLDRLRADSGAAVLMISHDMLLVADHCPQVLVLDHGRIVESGDTRIVLAAPTHPATRELLG